MKLHPAAAFLIGSALYAQVPELDRWVGRDLRSVPANQLQRLNEMLGEIPNGSEGKPVPWHVWKTSREGQVRYIVVLGEGTFIIPPPPSAARIQLFDGAGKSVTGWSFNAGVFLGDAFIAHSKFLDGDLIVLDATPRAYFLIENDHLRLVRLEGTQREASQNEYVLEGWEDGVVPDAKSAAQFAGLLESNDKTGVLSALVFLGGRHLAGPDSIRGDGKYAKLFQEVIGDPRIHELIERLTTSDNDWIAQAAKLAARGPRERPLN